MDHLESVIAKHIRKFLPRTNLFVQNARVDLHYISPSNAAFWFHCLPFLLFPFLCFLIFCFPFFLSCFCLSSLFFPFLSFLFLLCVFLFISLEEPWNHWLCSCWFLSFFFFSVFVVCVFVYFSRGSLKSWTLSLLVVLQERIQYTCREYKIQISS